jgi:hypothetical protein
MGITVGGKKLEEMSLEDLQRLKEEYYRRYEIIVKQIAKKVNKSYGPKG